MPDNHNPPFFRSLRFRYGLALLFFLSLGGYFLWQEHEAHIREYFPTLLILGACFGMHFFMHRGHGGHGSSDDDGDRR